MCYWLIEGIGVRESRIRPHLDSHLCFLEISKSFPEEDVREDEFNIDDWLDGGSYQNLGDFIASRSEFPLSSGFNGNGESFFFYQRTFPWERTNNDPGSAQEARNILIKAIRKVTNLSRKEAYALIEDDIYEVGWG